MFIRNLNVLREEIGDGGGAGGAPNTPTPPAVTIPENWHQALPEDLRGDATVQKYRSVQDLAKAHVHLQKQLGKDKITIPDQFASKEDWDGVFAKLGKPNGIDGYELKLPEGFSEEDAAWLKQTALESNMLPNQLENLISKYSERSATLDAQFMEQAKQEKVEAEKALRAEWGVAYDTELKRVEQTARQLFDQDGLKSLEEAGVFGNVHMLKALHKVSDMMKEHKIVGANGSGATFEGKTPAQAQEEINRIYGDKNHPYLNPSHPGNAKAVEYMSSLFEMVEAGKES